VKLSSLSLAAVIAIFLVPAASAVPIYTLNAGTLSYTNSYGVSEGDTFSFTGPQPVSVSGGGGNNVSYQIMQLLNTPFDISLPVYIDDTGNEAGDAQANGIDYGASQYISTPTLTNSSPFTLTAGNLTVSEPATLQGLFDVCTPDQYCPGGSNPGGGLTGNPFDATLGTLSGTLTVTYSPFNPGSGSPDYVLTSAVFTIPTASAPEPSTLLIFASGAGALVYLRRKRFANPL